MLKKTFLAMNIAKRYRRPSQYRTAIDIQDLLRWTYQDQAADRYGRAWRACSAGCGATFGHWA